MNVREMMKVWIDQKGFPIVSIRKRGNSFVIEQEDFLDKIRLKQDIEKNPAPR